MSSGTALLDAAAADRKARLAKLASLKRKQPPDSDETIAKQLDSGSGATAETLDTIKHLSGRNYDHETRGPILGFENAPTGDKETLELRAKNIVDAAHDRDEKENKEDKPLDLFALQPKKPNWDLKRDLAQKTNILDQRTDNAIARLVRERVEGQKRKETAQANGTMDGSNAESVGLSGVDLVEGVRIREQEEAEEERREREVQDL